MNYELTRLRAAIATIHNHLHSGRINDAHEACECAMSGGAISQPNLTIPDSAKVQVFAARFNSLCEELDMRAAFMAMLPSATVPGAFSFQIGGEVLACKVMENKFNKKSVYQGEHAK